MFGLDKMLGLDGSKSGALAETKSGPSFTDYLPWMEYTPSTKTFLLEDGKSVGAVWEIDPIGTEGRSDAFKETLRDQTINLIADTIPELEHNPWVLQVFVNDEFYLQETANAIVAYGKSHVDDDDFARAYQNLAARHLRRVCTEGGIFRETASDCPWRGRRRRVRLVLYRRLSTRRRAVDLSPDDELNEIGAKVELALRGAGLRLKRYNGDDFYQWLLVWLNPKPAWMGGDSGKLLEQAPYPGDDDLPFGRDFSEMLCP